MNQAKKSLGQHWLDDEFILGEIVRFARVQAGDTVLEIGPGYGSLSRTFPPVRPAPIKAIFMRL